MNTKILFFVLAVVILVVSVVALISTEETNFIGTDKSNISVTFDERVLDQKLAVDPSCGGFIPEPCGPIEIFGSVYNLSSITVALVNQGYSGSTDFNAVLDATKRLDTQSAKIKTVSVVSESWSATFPGTFVGKYRVLIYDSKTKLLLMDKPIIIR